MTRDCNYYMELIPRALLGDLAGPDLQALESHLVDCAACAQERELYSGTFRQMRSLEDVPVPRHFLVYPEEQTTNPWRLFRTMSSAWQGAAAMLLLIVGVSTVLAATSFRARFEGGVFTVAFGKLPAAPSPSVPSPAFDVAALEARILQIVEQRDRKESLEWVKTLRAEMAQIRRGSTRQQQVALDTALASLETRMGNRIELTARSIQDQNERSLAGVYQTVSRQRERDIAAVDGKFARLAVNDEIKSTQTDAILETLLQVAELRLK